ncbi:MAG TPA: hypothetical protein VFK05_28415 [Polyangiaceae bacterium]|nr:hypothetical protein [Polyangiaceae bacterium]
MSSVSRFLLVSALFCAQSVVACGGSADAPDNAASGGRAGAENAGNSAGTSAHSAGASSHSAGAGPVDAGGSPAIAGAPGSAGQSTGGPADTGGGTKLSQITSDAQALAVCNRIKDAFSDAELKKMVQGSCAITGQTGAASQQGTCEELQAECTAHTPLPSTDDGSCTAEDIPDCDDVTVDEYVACTRAVMAGGIEFLSGISCETDLESLETPATPSVCKAPFARCPDYAAVFQ